MSDCNALIRRSDAYLAGLHCRCVRLKGHDGLCACRCDSQARIVIPPLHFVNLLDAPGAGPLTDSPAFRRQDV